MALRAKAVGHALVRLVQLEFHNDDGRVMHRVYNGCSEWSWAGMDIVSKFAGSMALILFML